MTSPVRVAIIGLDHWYIALPLAHALAARRDVELVGIADAEPGRAEQVAQQTGTVAATGDIMDLAVDPSVQAIVSMVSVDRNPAVCIAAAETGKHILCTKPVARTLDEAVKVREAVRRAGVSFLPGESRARGAEHSRMLRDWVREGRFGRIVTASFGMWAGLPRGWPTDDHPGWFADPARAPGGAWIDHGVYHIDMLRWLLGSEVRVVTGRTANVKYPDLPVEDYGHAVAEFADGAVATIEDTWTAAPGGFRTSMTMVGTDGAVAYDSIGGRLAVTGMGGPVDGWVEVTPKEMRADGVDLLLAGVRGDGPPVATVDDAVANLAACDAFYRASASGRSCAPVS